MQYKALEDSTPHKKQYLRRLHEFSFSIYLALLIVAEESWKVGSAFLGKLGYPLINYLYPVAHLHPGLVLHTIALWCLLAGIIFVSLTLLTRIPFMGAFLRNAAGVITVAGFPLTWLHLGNLTGLSAVGRQVLVFELVAILSGVVLYLWRAWRVHATLSVLIVVLHFGFWGWVTWRSLSWTFWSVYLALGICAAVFWGWYLELFRTRRSIQAAHSV